MSPTYEPDSNPTRARTSAFFRRALFADLAIALAVIGLLVGSPRSSAARPGTAPHSSDYTAASVRIGVYDSRAVGMAYGRSATMAAELQQLHAEHAKAKAAGDNAKVKQLEKQGEARQVRLHLQVFSNAPVEDAMETIRAELPGVAERARVVAIVSSVDFTGNDVETVDVTDEVAKLFNPDQQTLKLIADSRKNKPLLIEEVAKLPADK